MISFFCLVSCKRILEMNKSIVTNLYNYLPSKKHLWRYIVDIVYANHSTHPELYTCIDCRTAHDAISLLTLLSQNNTSLDNILDRLLRIYKQFIPSEISLQSLSIESQRYDKQGGREEFSVYTVFISMNIAISETNLQKIRKNRRLIRRMSF